MCCHNKKQYGGGMMKQKRWTRVPSTDNAKQTEADIKKRKRQEKRTEKKRLRLSASI